MKTDIEIKNAIFARREKYAAEKKRNIKKRAAVAACLLAAVIIGAGALGFLKSRGADGPEGSGGTQYIPTRINLSDTAVKITGEELTDIEIDEYLSKNRRSIMSSLSASGVDTENAAILNKGYCHIRVKEDGLSLDRSFRERLVINGDTLIAVLTFVKENGKIYSTPAFGGQWCDTYHKFLSEHSGEELICCYIGNIEFFVSKNADVYNPSGTDVPAITREVAEAIASSDCAQAVFVP